MNKKTVSKVNLFFDGLVSRMEENKDFFNDIYKKHHDDTIFIVYGRYNS